MRVLKIAVYEFRLMFLSSRFLVLSLVSFLFMDMAMRPIREFAADYGLAITPAVLPFYFSDVTYCNIAFLLLVLLYSDIPLKGMGQRFLLQRGKSMAVCGMGHLLALFLLGIVFVSEQVLFSFLTSLPDITAGGWGKVWGSIASNQAVGLGYRFSISASDVVLRNYTPLQAVTVSAALFFLTGCIYGLVEYLLNGLSGGKLGTVVLTVWSLGWIFLEKSLFPGLRKLLDYSPQSWNDLSRLDLPESGGRMAVLAVAVLLLMAVVVVLVRHRKIELVK